MRDGDQIAFTAQEERRTMRVSLADRTERMIDRSSLAIRPPQESLTERPQLYHALILGNERCRADSYLDTRREHESLARYAVLS
jgi:hypothetical protein